MDFSPCERTSLLSSPSVSCQTTITQNYSGHRGEGDEEVAKERGGRREGRRGEGESHGLDLFPYKVIYSNCPSRLE
jgi:hypothetical protein